MSMTEDRLPKLGVALPEVPAPTATDMACRPDASLLDVSGQRPRKPDSTDHVHLVGANITTEQTYENAHSTGLGLLAVARAAAVTPDRMRVRKLFGLVRGTPNFADHPRGIDGCSDLFETVLGEDGRHARSAVGTGSLSNGTTFEIECVLGLED